MQQTSAEGGAKLLDGKATALEIRREVAQGCAELERKHAIVPGLAVVLAGQDPGSEIYVRNKARAAERAGMRSRVERLPASITEAELLTTVDRLNADPAVHGILVQLPLPLPPEIDPQRVIEGIDPNKDVDGFHPINAGRF